MDPLTQVPASAALNDSTGPIRDIFQEYLERPQFPIEVARNIRIYSVDDNLSLKEAAKNTLEIQRSLEEESQIISGAELEMLQQHADYVLRQREENEFLREMMRLKPCEVFASICLPDKLKYGLLEKCDLYPEVTRQFLDFRFNPSLHRCQRCFPTAVNLRNSTRTVLPKEAKERQPPKGATLIVQPPRVVFQNFQPNSSLEQSFQIKNVSNRVQRVSVREFPKRPDIFQLHFASCRQLAPGMCLKGAIRFTPLHSNNLQDCAQFISGSGELLTLPIQSLQSPPRLQGFISKSPSGFPRVSPGFSLQRQSALNDSIDFGGCFSTNHVLLSLLLTNHGHKGRFFWLTEEEFCGQDVQGSFQTVSQSLEMRTESFWIYPSYFELMPGEICQIQMLFQPIQCGFQAQPMRLMCDNNTYRQIELIGDAVCFNRNMIDVEIPHQVQNLQNRPGHRIFLGYRREGAFTLRISNRSALLLRYHLEMGSWMRVSNWPPQCLAPYSLTEVALSCVCPPEVPGGYYSTQMRLLIQDVPVASLESRERFLVATRAPLEDIVRNLSVVDVQVMQVEVACFAGLPPEKEGLPQSKTPCPEPISLPVPTAQLEFSSPFLDFGILPVGVDVSKTLSIQNLGPLEQAWHIEEMEYHLDSPPYAHLRPDPPISRRRGRLSPGKSLQITYTLQGKPAGRGVSILALLTLPPSPHAPEAQSICVVTYEVIELDIHVKTGQSSEAILCPMRMLYVGVPEALTFELHNRSLIPAAFHFMEPLGADAPKVQVVYQPLSGELKGGCVRKIHLQVTCFEVGIVEKVILPCFIGQAQAPLQVRLLCLVDCLHVFFHLPGTEGGKVLWPPKVIYEYGGAWSSCCLCEEEPQPTAKVCNDTETEEEVDKEAALLDTLLSADSEFFLQECVVEVQGVPTGKPKRVRIYVENLTPKEAKYCVQTTNYPAQGCVRPTQPDALWRPMIQRHGILVQPQTENGWLNQHQLLPVDIWIYANTWGLYSEEVVVDLEDIAPFSFSLLIEVVGGPLELPLAMGGIPQRPTVRLGAVCLGVEGVSREILMKNTSSIEASVEWRVVSVKEGHEDLNAMPPEEATGLEVSLDEGEGLEVKAGAELCLPILLKPSALSWEEDEQEFHWVLLGRIVPKDPVCRLQSSYFLRQPALLRIEVTATLVKPQLQVELLSESPLQIYANQVALERCTTFSLECLLKNPTPSTLEVELQCSEPLTLGPSGPKVLIGPRQCHKVQLECLLSYERILKWAPQVYTMMEAKEVATPRSSLGTEARPQAGEERMFEEEHKVLTLHRKLAMFFGGAVGGRKVMPIDIMIYYPHILLKPAHVKFGYVLLGRTQKAILTIYNLTGYAVLFEVYKTIATQEIFVTPSSGRIAESVGGNHSFSNVSVFFTPKGRRSYKESIRIVTNIPQYYVDVPIKGEGTFNEKFD